MSNEREEKEKEEGDTFPRAEELRCSGWERDHREGGWVRLIGDIKLRLEFCWGDAIITAHFPHERIYFGEAGFSLDRALQESIVEIREKLPIWDLQLRSGLEGDTPETPSIETHD